MRSSPASPRIVSTTASGRWARSGSFSRLSSRSTPRNMITKRNSTTMAPAYTMTWTAARKLACCSTKSTATPNSVMTSMSGAVHGIARHDDTDGAGSTMAAAMAKVRASTVVAARTGVAITSRSSWWDSRPTWWGPAPRAGSGVPPCAPCEPCTGGGIRSSMRARMRLAMPRIPCWSGRRSMSSRCEEYVSRSGRLPVRASSRLSLWPPSGARTPYPSSPDHCTRPS